jgi:hypothetical protein
MDMSIDVYDKENIEYLLVGHGFTLQDVRSMKYTEAFMHARRVLAEKRLMLPLTYLRNIGIPNNSDLELLKGIQYPDKWVKKKTSKPKTRITYFDVSDVIIKHE